MASLSLKNICKKYSNGYEAVKDFNLEIADKEFIIFVGPSGCGKSTTLRMVAGLEDISSGELRIDGKLVNDVEPKDRDIAMVFQNYALYPHMTVYDNMAFGLKLRKVSSEKIDEMVKEAARVLDLEKLLDRKPKALSGGQRQRVAIARALANEPPLLLADEPTGNLDTAASVEIMELFSQLHKEGTTVVVVTHEEEIAAFTERIIRFRDGEVVSDLPNVPREPERYKAAGAREPEKEEAAGAGKPEKEEAAGAKEPEKQGAARAKEPERQEADSGEMQGENRTACGEISERNDESC